MFKQLMTKNPIFLMFLWKIKVAQNRRKKIFFTGLSPKLDLQVVLYDLLQIHDDQTVQMKYSKAGEIQEGYLSHLHHAEISHSDIVILTFTDLAFHEYNKRKHILPLLYFHIRQQGGFVPAIL